MTHRVTLAVGHVFVTGEGPSPQAARHHAAQQALEQLRDQSLINKAQLDGKFFNLCYSLRSFLILLYFTEAAVISEANTDLDVKSPVSLAHELALKLNLTVEFTVVSIFKSIIKTIRIPFKCLLLSLVE